MKKEKRIKEIKTKREISLGNNTSSKLFYGLNRRKIIHIFLFMLVAALVAWYFAQTRMLLAREDSKVTLQALIDGNSSTPFQYRYLVPWLMKKILQGTFLNNIITGKNAALFFDAMFTFFLLLGFRYYLSFFIRQAKACYVLAFSILIPLACNYIVTLMVDIPLSGVFYKPLYFPYDIPAVMFITFGLILIHKRNWTLYYLLFVLATLNRETSCFLTVIYALVAYGRDKNSTIAVHVAAQAAIWISIKMYLKILFAANTGTVFDLTIIKSLIYMTEPYYYKQMLSNLAGTWLIVALFYGRIKDRFLRRSVIVAIPFYVGMMFVGNLYELRIFAELAPVLTPAAIVIIKGLLTEEEFDEG